MPNDRLEDQVKNIQNIILDINNITNKIEQNIIKYPNNLKKLLNVINKENYSFKNFNNFIIDILDKNYKVEQITSNVLKKYKKEIQNIQLQQNKFVEYIDFTNKNLNKFQKIFKNLKLQKLASQFQNSYKELIKTETNIIKNIENIKISNISENLKSYVNEVDKIINDKELSIKERIKLLSDLKQSLTNIKAPNKEKLQIEKLIQNTIEYQTKEFEIKKLGQNLPPEVLKILTKIQDEQKNTFLIQKQLEKTLSEILSNNNISEIAKEYSVKILEGLDNQKDFLDKLKYLKAIEEQISELTTISDEDRKHLLHLISVSEQQIKLEKSKESLIGKDFKTAFIEEFISLRKQLGTPKALFTALKNTFKGTILGLERNEKIFSLKNLPKLTGKILTGTLHLTGIAETNPIFNVAASKINKTIDELSIATKKTEAVETFRKVHESFLEKSIEQAENNQKEQISEINPGTVLTTIPNNLENKKEVEVETTNPLENNIETVLTTVPNNLKSKNENIQPEVKTTNLLENNPENIFNKPLEVLYVKQLKISDKNLSEMLKKKEKLEKIDLKLEKTDIKTEKNIFTKISDFFKLILNKIAQIFSFKKKQEIAAMQNANEINIDTKPTITGKMKNKISKIKKIFKEKSEGLLGEVLDIGENIIGGTLVASLLEKFGIKKLVTSILKKLSLRSLFSGGLLRGIFNIGKNVVGTIFKSGIRLSGGLGIARMGIGAIGKSLGGLTEGAAGLFAAGGELLGTAGAALTPLLGPAALIAGAAGLGYLIYKNKDKIAKVFKSAWNDVKGLGKSLYNGAKNLFDKGIKDISSFAKSATNFVSKHKTLLLEALFPPYALYKLLTSKTVKNIVNNVVNKVKSIGKSIYNSVKGIWDSIFHHTKPETKTEKVFNENITKNQPKITKTPIEDIKLKINKIYQERIISKALGNIKISDKDLLKQDIDLFKTYKNKPEILKKLHTYYETILKQHPHDEMAKIALKAIDEIMKTTKSINTLHKTTIKKAEETINKTKQEVQQTYPAMIEQMKQFNKEKESEPIIINNEQTQPTTTNETPINTEIIIDTNDSLSIPNILFRMFQLG